MQSWESVIKYVLVYRLKVTVKPRRWITVKKILNAAEDYIYNKFPNNNNVEQTIYKTLQHLARLGYLIKTSYGWRYNPHYVKPLLALPVGIGAARLGNVAIQIDLKAGAIYENYHGQKIKIAEVIA